MKGVKCVACGFVGWADQETCKKCGASMTSPMPAQSYGAQPPAGYQPNYQPWTPPPTLKQGLAITSLVFGLVNFLCVGFMGAGAVTGLTFGIVALTKAKKRPDLYGGQGLAIAGVVTNGFWLLVAFPIIMAIAIPNLLASRRAANEGSAISSLRSIAAAEDDYYRARQRYGTLSDLSAEHLITPELASGTHYGYRFAVSSRDLNVVRKNFEATAVPLDYGKSGRRSFLIDESGMVRADDNGGREVSRSARPLEDRRSLRSDDD